MPTFPLARGQSGGDVKRLQGMLNRLGALLGMDGKFGAGTEQAVRDVQADRQLAATGQVDAALWSLLRSIPEPCAQLPTEGVTFIAREEIASRQLYDQRYCRPCWPGGDSGVTIGVGYDLRFCDEAQLRADWNELPAATLSALVPVLKVQGSAAKAAALAAVLVPFAAAWAAFVKVTLPQYAAQTGRAFPGYDRLSPLCKSALVSLVYNRGPSFADEDRRREMRAIRDLVATGQVDQVPAQFESMKRLWPDGNGLRDRRDREAELWRQGLA